LRSVTMDFMLFGVDEMIWGDPHVY
jgi:hypothetical protein